MNAKGELVYLYVLTGNSDKARDLVSAHFPGACISEVSHRKFRGGGFVQKFRTLRQCRGRAFVFFYQSLCDSRYIQLLKCLHVLHRCSETVLSDETGRWEAIGLLASLRNFPAMFVAALGDSFILVFRWCWLHQMLGRAVPVDQRSSAAETQVAYLIPNHASLGSAGGAISHVRGVLTGLQKIHKTCRVFCGAALAQDVFRNEIISPSRRPSLFWEAAALSFDRRFVRGVRNRLASSRPALLYQRHRRFSIAGACLSRALQVPLVLEYNGSEVWISRHWDPTPFRAWVRLCEEISIRSAARVLVVSDVLRSELLARHIPASRIVVNPNAVDPNLFHPGCGGIEVREKLKVQRNDVLIGFVGSFSFWHGIEVLQQAIYRLMMENAAHLRFVLVGDGLLRESMRSFLMKFEASGKVFFPGVLPQETVATYMDAADILVSPHIPMPDGNRFFGSPTKLFEYMAMGKAILASRLDQLGEILEHGRTAWLVTPGSVAELSEGIQYLAGNPAARSRLGNAARCMAVERHSWEHNAARALENL